MINFNVGSIVYKVELEKVSVIRMTTNDFIKYHSRLQEFFSIILTEKVLEILGFIKQNKVNDEYEDYIKLYGNLHFIVRRYVGLYKSDLILSENSNNIQIYSGELKMEHVQSLCELVTEEIFISDNDFHVLKSNLEEEYNYVNSKKAKKK